MTDFIDDLFGTSVQTAVQTSLSENKPLLAFLTNERESSTEFVFKFLYKDDELNSRLVAKLKDAFVPIKLIEGTTEFGFFQQIFKELIIPSFYIVTAGKLVNIIKYDTDIEEWEETISGADSRKRSVASEQTPTSSTLTRHINHSETTASASTLASTPLSEPSETSVTSPISSSSLIQHQNHLRSYNRAKNLETQRIRALLAADQKERDSKRKDAENLKHFLKDSSIPEPSTTAATTNTSSPSPNSVPICKLSIKLFDGTSLKHDFLESQTLTDVRQWLDEETEYSIIPNASSMPSFATPSDPIPTRYVFYRPVLPRITFTDEQETFSLKSLQLSPRSALILKPIFESPVNNASNPGATSGVLSNVGGVIKKVGSALFSFFDYGMDHIDEESDYEDSRSPSSNGSSNNANEGESENYFNRLQINNSATPPLVAIDSQVRSPQLNRSSSLLDLEPSQSDLTPGLNSPRLGAQEMPPPISRSGTPKSSSRIRVIGGNGAEVNENNDENRDDELKYNGNSIGLRENTDE